MADKVFDKIEKLRAMAAVLRQQAEEALLPEYRRKMERTAADLEAEADRLERNLPPQRNSAA